MSPRGAFPRLPQQGGMAVKLFFFFVCKTTTGTPGMAFEDCRIASTMFWSVGLGAMFRVLKAVLIGGGGCRLVASCFLLLFYAWWSRISTTLKRMKYWGPGGGQAFQFLPYTSMCFFTLLWEKETGDGSPIELWWTRDTECARCRYPGKASCMEWALGAY